MALACARLAASISHNCDTPPVAGLESRVYIINHDDIAEAVITRDVSNSLIITDIALASGVSAYTITSAENAWKASFEDASTQFATFYKHMAEGYVFDLTAETLAQLNNLAKGRVAIVVENLFRGTAGETTFEMYGINTGLKMKLSRTSDDAETGGAYKLTFESREGKFEQAPPARVFDTNYTTTKAMLDALV